MNTEQEKIDQMNEAIALFEGRKRAVVNERGKAHHFWSDPTGTNPLYSPTLHYHESWDELMPAYQKLRELIFIDTSEEGCVLFAKIQDQILFGTIQDAHLKIYDFIQWYNQQSPTTK